MTRTAAMLLCLSVPGALFAQKKATTVKKAPSNKSAIAGVIHNMRRQPVSGIQAFVYKKDSIAASGYSDSMGYFETNYAVPGIYDLKLAYPTGKTVLVTGVPVKARALTMVDCKINDPIADTTIAYATLVPTVKQKG